jgi:acyl-CoA thioester hydrolase
MSATCEVAIKTAAALDTYRGAVYPWHCDQMGHMNVMWYVGKFDEATWNLFAELGLTASFLKENGRGMAAVQQNITYKRELHAGDLVSVKTILLEVRSKVVKFVHEMRNGPKGEIAAIMVLTAVHIDTTARKACALPNAILERGASMIGAYDLPT